MLGYPAWIQGDAFRDIEATVNPGHVDETELLFRAADWRLLLQVDSVSRGMEQGMMWGDVGLIYFCIRKDDLAARDFSKVWLVLQCG